MSASPFTLLCWVNSAKDPNSKSIRLESVDKTNPLLPDGSCVFVNLPNPTVQKAVADRLRGCFGTTRSYQMLLDLTAVEISAKSGSKSIRLESADFKRALISVEKAPEKKMTDDDMDLIEFFGAPSGSLSEDDDDFGF